MKAKRHARVLKIIRDKVVETQEDLARELRKEGFKVTQATVSRDIKELRITKLPTSDGRYRYGLPHERSQEEAQRRLERLFADSVVAVDFSENLVVIKTLTGNAHAVAAAIDEADFKEIVGTIAGDDTILAVVRPKSAVPELLGRFNRLRRPSPEERGE
ncbi:MAG TPA: arginine repressor [Firmicutes bacterium]|nr:arginine repressor [Bacillota bacterium]